MPADYQTLLNDLGVDTSQSDAGATQPTDTNPTTPDTGNDGGEPAAADNGTAAPVADQKQPEDNDAQRRNEAFAAMRSENSKYKKFMSHLMKGAGFEGKEEDFMNQLSEASYKKQAERQGSQVSPEILKRMDSLESANKQLLESQNRQAFAANLKNMQETLQLSDSDIKEFINLAVKENIDLTIPGTNFVTLYQGLFFDKLKEKFIESARQEWIAQSTKSSSAANPDGKSGKKDPAPTNVNTMAEFDSLLQQSFPNNK